MTRTLLRMAAVALTIAVNFQPAWAAQKIMKISAPQPVSAASDAVLPSSYAPLAFAGLSLEQAEADAIAQSPDVTIARSRLDGAAAILAAARGGFGPSVIAGYTSNPQAGNSPSSVVTQRLFNVGLQDTLANLAGYLPALYQAQASYNAARADVATAQRLERVRAATLYFTALRARATLAARREALELANAQERAAQRRFNAGDAPHVDVVRAQVVAAAALAASVDAQAADANASEALALETGYTQPLATAPGEFPELSLTPLTPEAAIQQSASQRAEIIAANQDVNAANAALGVAKTGVAPSLTVSAGYAYGKDVGQSISGPMITAALEFPLNGSQSSRIHSAQAALTEAQAHLAAAQRQVTTEVSSAVRTLNASVLATAASTKARLAASDELKATTVGYRTGASSSLDLAIASTTYADARLAELSAIYDEALDRAVVTLETGP